MNPISGQVASAASARDALERASALERAGQLEAAEQLLATALGLAGGSDSTSDRIDALRRIGLVRHRLGQSDRGAEDCRSSLALARSHGSPRQALEAMNVLAGIDLERGELDTADQRYREILAEAGDEIELRGRAEQNLGILANIRGDWAEAERWYRQSLEAFRRAENAKGCAIAYHNLGMISADREDWALAEDSYARGLELAREIGDRHLEALCLLNRSEVLVSVGRADDAAGVARAANEIFAALGSKMDVAAAEKQLGAILRHQGEHEAAEALLARALGLAVATGASLVEAETCREMALLYRVQDRNRESLQLLNRAFAVFRRLDARVDLVDVETRRDKLESTFLAVVRDWGQSIESADSYTSGHCSRVAEFSVQVAGQLGLSEEDLLTIRLGAYLHDVGKVEVPLEILNKPGRLTEAEFDVIKQHPMMGIRLLEGIEFPWDLKPIIRWHHEKHDGSGYPDGLAGEAIPLHAQIVCIADVFDALTTNRAYRDAMGTDRALRIMRESHKWWRSDVFEAFMASAEAGTLPGVGRSL
ncbi:MAG: tetratricopeptide repeat protein [Gemmatimonadales bacterium]